MAKQIAEMEIESVVMELPDVKTVRFKWPEGYDPGDFKTGQFITVYWPHKTKYKRAYSLSSCALDKGYFEVSIKRDGKMGTSVVDWAEAGDKMFVIPPVGKFLPVFDPPDKHLICVAGGSGVTPFRGFVREATARGLHTKITILYTVRTPMDIIFEKEFRELEAKNPHFKFHVTCTRLAPDSDWSGRRGRITPEWVRSFVTDAANTVFYACGTTAMVESVEQLVREDLGLPKEQMKLEKWG
jgi:ferredoxin-NADP reductase